jgi:hypothetical protein
MGDERVEQAKEKRCLAALIRQYAAWLDPLDKADLLAYAARIEAEADRLEREDADPKAPASARRKSGAGPSDGA